MTYFVIITLSVYCLWLVIMLISWQLIRPVPFGNEAHLKLTVIVPFRNESQNLSALIHSFNNLNLERLSVEFLFVNDHSSDDFERILELNKPDYALFSLPDNMSGKKAAITFGVEHSTGDIIVTTDADCEVQPNWLQVINQYFQSTKVNMAFGGVTFKPVGFFDKLQLVEFAPLIGTGAASLNIGQPFMCNGANLAFRKSAFEGVKGYVGNEHIASGDDEFLLAKFHKHLQGEISFMKDKEAVVSTSGSKDIKTFFNQRKRWSSKWNKNLSVYKIFLALMVLLTAGATIMGLINLAFSFNMLVLTILIVKIILEGIFIGSIQHHLNSSFNIFYYLLVQLVYPFYVLIFGAVANWGGYKWKGRAY
ncbi:glycosyltransferase [Fulvivirga lutimaris]|uniref:glycosyltransferase n=1 Tax=Fulvivirga lutimaris TaxID=1819566 RepID=UPI0012BD606B|nr:glycosyltransferase [Fulvivirga lutimaris]MTI38562.1 glycosyltransferase [Fulvivirga lutimaris]